MDKVESNVMIKNGNSELADETENKNKIPEGFGGFDTTSTSDECELNEDPNTVYTALYDSNVDENSTNERCELKEDEVSMEDNVEIEKNSDTVILEVAGKNLQDAQIQNIDTIRDDGFSTCQIFGFEDNEVDQAVISTMHLKEVYSRTLSAAFNESGIKESDDDSISSLTPIKDNQQAKISPKKKQNTSKKITFNTNYTHDSSKMTDTKKKRKKLAPSLNVLFREPFKYGWKRELVIRQSLKPKACGDVYYFSPLGKKFRSLREVNETLPSDGPLTAANFSFTPEAIFINNESDKEVVRPAKVFAKKDKKPKNYFDSLKKPVNKVNDEAQEKGSLNSSLERTNESGSQGLKRKSTCEDITTAVKKLFKTTGSLSEETPTDDSKGGDSIHGEKETRMIENSDETDSDDDKIMKNILENKNSISSTNGKVEEISARGTGFTKPKSTMPKIVFRRLGTRPGIPKYTKPRKSIPTKIEDKQTKSPVKGMRYSEEKDEEFVSGMLPPDYKSVENNLATSSVASSERQKTLEVCSISCEKATGTVPTLQCKICLCLFHPQCCGIETQKPIVGYECPNCNNSSSEIVASSSNSVLPTTTSPIQTTMGVKTPNELNEANKNLNDGMEISPFGKSVITVTASPGDKTPPFMQSLIEISGRKYIVVPRQSIIPADLSQSAFQKMDSPLKSPPPLTTDSDNIQSVITPATTQGGVYYLPVVRSYPVNSTATTSDNKLPEKEDKSNEKHKGSNVAENKATKEKNSNEDNSQNSVKGSSNAEDEEEETPTSHVSISTVATLHTPLVQVFRYLKVHEMLKIARTCKYFNCIIHDDNLWRTVKMRNSLVHDWKQFANTLIRHRTKTLDLKKMLVSNKPDELEKMWEGFIEEIPKATSLETIDICKCPSFVIEKFSEKCKGIQFFTALSIKSDLLDCTNVCSLPKLKLLRLRGFTSLALNGSLKPFASSSTITTLTLLNINNLTEESLEIISNMVNLETLEIGECKFTAESELSERWLSKLINLRKLRLEKLPDMDPKYHLIKAIGKLNKLTRLELINIDVKYGFDRALASCSNIKELLIIPTYITQSATTNQLVINGTNCLSKTLEIFVWGLTVELLKVTDLFIDKWQDQKSTNHQSTKSNSIPILKSTNVDAAQESGSIAVGQVDIIQISKLEKMLVAMLPRTKIKILKIPFASTWRQTI